MTESEMTSFDTESFGRLRYFDILFPEVYFTNNKKFMYHYSKRYSYMVQMQEIIKTA